MKVLLSWLKELVDFPYTAQELADRLSLAGIEVEGLRYLGEGLEQVLIGRLTAVEPHPKADRLRVCTVDVGRAEPVVILTAAENVRQGDIVPAALAGARLTTGLIEPRTMRGVLSNGMLCSLYELGLEAKQGEGIYVLPASVPQGESHVPPDQLIGRKATEVFGLDDWLLEVAPTPNRSDCLSMLGVAREVAAIAGTEVRPPQITLPPGESEAVAVPEVQLDDPNCNAYHLGLIKGLMVGPSPDWMKRRLQLCGFRSINNVVDVTNYVMHELGQPLHAFDEDQVSGAIVVRPAREGEILTTIDGSKLQLDPAMMVIADEQGAQALAGVMGGLSSEVSETTTAILLESAYFVARSVRRSSLAVNIHSESAIRFRQGVDRLMVRQAFNRAVQLLHLLAEGQGFAWNTRSAYSSDYMFQKMAEETPAPAITLRRQRLELVLGYAPDWAGVPQLLTRLGCRVATVDDASLQAVPPSWRDEDLIREIDLIEEVARLEGYGRIPTTLPRRTMAGANAPRLELAGRCRRLLCGMGLTEAVTSTMVGGEALRLGDRALAAKAIRNPITSDLDHLRPTLLVSHLGVLKENLQFDQEDVHLFEYGQVFDPAAEGQAAERWRLGGLLHGTRWRGLWREAPEEYRSDFFAAKGIVFGLLEVLGIKDCRVEPLSSEPAYHPGRAAAIFAGEAQLGTLGELHPDIAEQFQARERVYVFDLDFAQLQEQVRHLPTVLYQAPSRFPAVYRDISLAVPAGITAARVESAIRGAGGQLLESTACFDYFPGQGSESHSLAFHLVFRAPDRTLEDKDVERAQQAIEKALREQQIVRRDLEKS